MKVHAPQIKKHQRNYNKTSKIRTPMARLPWIIWTRFLSLYWNSSDRSRKQIVREIFIMILYVVHTQQNRLIESKWVRSTYHYCIEDKKKDFRILQPFAAWPGAMINPQWLELPMSRINFDGPKDGSYEVLLQLSLHHQGDHNTRQDLSCFLEK